MTINVNIVCIKIIKFDIVKKYFPNNFDAPIHEIGKSEFYFVFTGANSLGVSLLNQTYFNISVYQVNNYISEPAGSVVKQEIINFLLINWGDRFKQKISSPVFENLSLSKLIYTDTISYSIGGNLKSLMFEKNLTLLNFLIIEGLLFLIRQK